jgi:hypothetical protein
MAGPRGHANGIARDTWELGNARTAWFKRVLTRAAIKQTDVRWMCTPLIA